MSLMLGRQRGTAAVHTLSGKAVNSRPCNVALPLHTFNASTPSAALDFRPHRLYNQAAGTLSWIPGLHEGQDD